MTIQLARTDFNAGGTAYIDDVKAELIRHENDTGNYDPYYESSLAMGYGYDLIQNSIAEINEAFNHVLIDDLNSSQVAIINDAKSKQTTLDT